MIVIEFKKFEQCIIFILVKYLKQDRTVMCVIYIMLKVKIILLFQLCRHNSVIIIIIINMLKTNFFVLCIYQEALLSYIIFV